MRGGKKSTWIAATVFAALVVVVASWFLAVSPTLGAAADLNIQAEDTRSQNEILSVRVDRLRADFAKLDEYRAELDGLRVQVPTDAQLSDYLRQLDGIAVAHAVTIMAAAPGTPQAVTLPAAATPPAPEATTGPEDPAATPDAAATSDGGESTDGETPAPAEPAGPVIPDGFVAIPMAITVLGTYDSTLAFVSDLQKATPRLFLVSSLTATGQDEAEAGGGRPQTALGDQELVVTGFLWVLQDTTTATPAPTETPTAPALPAAVPGKNPLVPLGGVR